MKACAGMAERTLFALFGVALFLAGCVTEGVKGVPMQSEKNPTGFINKTLSVNGKQRPYVVYVPQNYTAGRQWPLVLFLHGAGERGDDGLIQTEVGIGRAIRRHAARFPCIVVMPQCPHEVWWDAVVPDIEAALDKTCNEYRIDLERVYLTGLSMGGFGTWVYGAAHPEKFAALMPICGGGNPNEAPKLASVPIWAFHGALDKTVPPAKSREMVEAIRNVNGNIKYTEFPDAEHNSWDQAYDDPDAIQWLFEQRKKP